MTKEITKTAGSNEIRQRAEKKVKLAKSAKADLQSLNEVDLRKVLHELEVHQIELEMQNDELLQAQQAIEKSRTKYFELYNLAPVCYLSLDDKGNILDLNLISSELLGYDKKDLIGSSIFNYIITEDRDILYLHLVKLLKTKSKQSCELRLIKRDGTQFYAQMIGTLNMDENHKILGCRSSIIDISESKQAEKDLQQAREFSQNILDTTQAIILILDLSGMIISINPFMELLAGYSLEDVKGKNWFDTFIPEQDRETIRNLFNNTVKKTTSKGYVNPIISQSGKKLYIEWHNKLLKDGDGNILYLLCTGHDITYHLKMENDINLSRERLKLLNKIIRHDLANDLAVIKSAVNIFRKNSNPEMIDEIETRVRKSSHTIDSYKSYEQFIDANFHLYEIELSETLREKAKEYPEIKFNIKGMGSVLADETINSVFTNLISNSIKHGKSDRIDIEIYNENTTVVLIYRDNGSVIPQKIKDKIFEEGFFWGETGHTGIGLHIVKQTITRFGGTITVEESQSGGATFIIKFKKRIIR